MARVVKIGPAPDLDVDGKFDDEDTGDFDPMPMANRAADLTDENPRVLANHMRAIQREMHSGFELLAQKLLTAINRVNEKLDDLIDWKREVTRWQAETDERLAALERQPLPTAKVRRRKPARRK